MSIYHPDIPLGHTTPTHQTFGWCAHCPGRTLEEELAAWQTRELSRLVDAARAAETPDQTQPADLAPMLEGFGRLLATSSRDWGEYRVDAWLYAVICGWDCEETVHGETCVHGAMQEMQARHGWSDEAVAKARRYRALVRALTEPAAVSQPGKEEA